jgi:RNA polymerase sigma-70 factor, ECF subfamily
MVECAVRAEPGFADDRQSVWQGIVARMATGEPAALADLYDKSSSTLYSLALRMVRTPEDAEEVVHDVYTRAWKTAGSYAETRGTVISWLILMTRSIAIDRLRSLRRHSKELTTLEPGFDTPGGSPTPEVAVSGMERQARLRSAMEALVPEQRELIELAFFGGMTHYEVAETTGLPVGTVKTRIRTGLQRMRTALEDLAL